MSRSRLSCLPDAFGGSSPSLTYIVSLGGVRTRMALRDVVESAFADVPHLGDDRITTCTGGGADEVLAWFPGRTSNGHSAQQLVRNEWGVAAMAWRRWSFLRFIFSSSEHRRIERLFELQQMPQDAIFGLSARERIASMGVMLSLGGNHSPAQKGSPPDASAASYARGCAEL